MNSHIQTNIELKPYNTLRIPAKTKYFLEIDNLELLQSVLSDPEIKALPKIILGGGSNILFTKDFEGLVLKMANKGITIIEETDVDVLVEVAAGENWHNFVSYVVEQGWGGIENLALIPGTVGAAPVQNIAAYGQNLADSFHTLDAINLQSGETKVFNAHDCQFGYRESIFKQELKHQCLIAKVRFKLLKQPNIETSYYSQGVKYESIQKELAEIAIPPYAIKDVYQAVVNIRTRQLPSIEEYPSAGSFFKNPIVTKTKFLQLQQQVPSLQYYPVENLNYISLDIADLPDNAQVKVAAGRLLDELGWRGKQIGNCRTFEKHALIVTHNEQATGLELLEFVSLMQADVEKQYGIKLEPEVRIV